MDHSALKPSNVLHRPGCLSKHESLYIEGDACSYRWQAALRARSDGRIEYIDPNAVAKQKRHETEANENTIKDWKKRGKAKHVRMTGRMIRYTLDSFTTEWWPWGNQAHHIIPYASLIQMLDDLAKQAEPRHQRALDVMINGLLREPYNLNDRPNMIILPTRDDDAVAMGLPRHLGGHENYNDAVRRELGKRVEPRYKALIAAIKAKKHPRGAKPPAVRPVLETLSIETYEEILGKTAVLREEGATKVSIDGIALLLYR